MLIADIGKGSSRNYLEFVVNYDLKGACINQFHYICVCIFWFLF